MVCGSIPAIKLGSKTMVMYKRVGRFTISIDVDYYQFPYPYMVSVVDPEGKRTEEGSFQTRLGAVLFIETDLRPGLEAISK